MSKKQKKKNKVERIEQERTGQQAFGASPYGRYIQYGNPSNSMQLKEIEKLRDYPTVQYCTDILTVIGDSSKWTVEADENVPWEAIHLVERFIDSCKTDVWRTGINGWITHGYCAYEKIYEVFENDKGESRVGLRRVKELLPQNILINMDAEKGFLGITVEAPIRVDLTPAKCLILTHNKQGDDLRGRPMLRAVKLGATSAQVAMEGMLRYEEKLAKGPKYKITYPWGKEMDSSGNMVDNADTAKQFVHDIENSCFALLPRRKNISMNQTAATQSDYDVEMFPQDATTSNFINDMQYLDKLIVRAFGIPERAVLEGLFGTKADASNGTDFLTLRIEYLVRMMVDQLNKYVVNPLMMFNFDGLADKVRIVPGTIDKRDVERITSLLQNVIATPYGQSVVLPSLDFSSMMDAVDWNRLQQNETKEQITTFNDLEGQAADINEAPPASWEKSI